MGFVNKVMLMGNTTRDPEVRQLPSGSAVCEFGLATNRVFKTTAGEEKQETVFIDCVAFGRTGEVIAEYCPKGRPLFIEGRLHYETWEDKNGNRRSKLSVIVENFQFTGSREGQEAAPAQPAARQRELPLAPAVQTNENRSSLRAQPPRRGTTGSTERFENGQRPDAPRGSGRKIVVKARGSEGGVATADPKTVDKMAEEAERMEDADLPF